MAFWKVAGFSQPSPIEQILDKEEFTLEELLDEDDIIQECKSLNGRLITFLREKKTVEQLLRYLIDPPTDSDDPKKQYRYPFTACEVFCCEVEAVFNTLLEDEELLRLLFSLLDQPPPLSCKAAGYFGRVVGQLLLRKTNEMMQHLSHNEEILEKLIKHVDTTSIADIIKRLVGADDHSSMIFSPMHTQWLADTPLVSMLLDRLGPEYTPHVQANAADILTAIAHTQPSALATQLMQQQSIQALFSRALQPGSRVLVTALDVCAALLEPRRSLDPGVMPGAPSGGPTDNGSLSGSGSPASGHAAAEAITSMLHYLPQLMQHLRDPAADTTTTSSTSAAAANSTSPPGIGDSKGGNSNSSNTATTPADKAAEGASGEGVAAADNASDKGASSDKGSAGGSSSSSTQGAGADAKPQDVSPNSSGGGAGAGTSGSSSSGGASSTSAASSSSSGDSITVRQDTPYGVLQPPLGRARLRIVELLAVLLRVGDDAVDAALIKAESMQIVQELFVAYPFNNLLHHQMYALLLAVLRRASPVMVSHLFGDCQLVSWLLGLPQEVTPMSRPGCVNKVPLRAGYLGHVTRIGQVLQEAAAQQQEIADVLQANPAWPELLQQLAPRFELEDVTRWQCGRPANTEGNELDSDGDEFPNDMESLEQIQGMPPGMYHRYGVLDDDMEDEDDDNAVDHAGGFDALAAAGGAGGAAAGIYSADMLVAGMAGLGVSDPSEGDEAAAGAGAAGGDAAGGVAGDEGEAAGSSGAAGQGNWSLLSHPGPSSSAVDIPGERLMDDDAVLLADDEDMGALTASTLDDSPPPGDLGNAAAAASPPSDDMVLVEDADVMQAAAAGPASRSSSSLQPQGVADTTMADAEAEPAAASPAAAASVAEPAAPAVPSNNPFAAASGLPQPSSSDASEPAAAADAQGSVAEGPAEAAGVSGGLSSPAAAASEASTPPAAGDDVSAAAGGAAAASAAATATATVEKAPGELLLGPDGKSPRREGSGKKQMASHPVEVPEELS